jgi:hypothetical protein
MRTLPTSESGGKLPLVGVRGVGLAEAATIKFAGEDTFVAAARSLPGEPAWVRQTTYTRVR